MERQMKKPIQDEFNMVLSMVTPNSFVDAKVDEESRLERMSRSARLGYKMVSSSDEWSDEHKQVICDLDQGALSVQEMSCFGQGGDSYALSFCLLVGYLLGLFNENKISEKDFHYYMSIIPGFLMGKGRKLPKF